MSSRALEISYKELSILIIKYPMAILLSFIKASLINISILKKFSAFTWLCKVFKLPSIIMLFCIFYNSSTSLLTFLPLSLEISCISFIEKNTFPIHFPIFPLSLIHTAIIMLNNPLPWPLTIWKFTFKTILISKLHTFSFFFALTFT